MKLEVDIKGMGHGQILLDGVDVSNAVSRLDFSAGVREVTRVRLDVVIQAGRLTGDVEVVIPAHTAELLQRIGWTPPNTNPPPPSWSDGAVAPTPHGRLIDGAAGTGEVAAAPSTTPPGRVCDGEEPGER